MPWYPIKLVGEGVRPFEADEYPYDFHKKINGKHFSSATNVACETYEKCLEYICPEHPGLRCKECNELISTHYTHAKDLLDLQLCFNCNFWKSHLDDPQGSIRIKGHHYRAGQKTTKGPFNGFGGQKFTIKMNDGMLIETCDLWHQGVVPEHFRNRLPDNAEFVNV